MRLDLVFTILDAESWAAWNAEHRGTGGGRTKDPVAWSKSLTDNEFGAVASYSQSNWKLLNQSLRQGPENTKIFDQHGEITDPARRDQHFRNMERMAKNLDSAIDKTELDSCTVYRGFDSDEMKANFDNLKGAIIEDKAFVSTTLSEDVASHFSGKSGIIAKIDIPDGSKGAKISEALGRYLGEKEILLPRGSKFEVVNAFKEGVGGISRLDLKLITD